MAIRRAHYSVTRGNAELMLSFARTAIGLKDEEAELGGHFLRTRWSLARVPAHGVKFACFPVP